MRNDMNHPFFRPLWRRVVLVAFCAIWSVVEWASGQVFWGAITGGIAAYAAWTFLWAYDPAAPTAGEDRTPRD